jgi:ComEC/Rec2-related protein
MKSIVDGIRIFLAVAMPYFRSEDRVRGLLLLAAVVAAELGLVWVAVAVTQWNARFFNALEAKNWAAFQDELVVFCFIAVAAIIAGMSQYYFGQTLQIRWRRWMTENYVSVWMAQGRHYRVRFVDTTIDNIHLRIANDVYLFIQRTHELGTGMLGSIVALVSFSYILWGLSLTTPLPLFGVNLAFPGYLIVAALLYAAIGTLIAHGIGWRLIGFQFNQQRYEADFRFAIVRAADHSEPIALMHGEPVERAELDRRVAAAAAGKALSRQYHAQWYNGTWLHAMLFATGSLLFYYKDIRHQNTSITRLYTAGNAVLVTIEEPLSEKSQSYKTIASVQAVLFNHSISKASGKLLLYFQKDSTVQHLHYGKQLLLFKALQPVKNTGNPGCFDYQRYCTFQGISYQVYLKKGEYAALKIENENLFRKYLFSTREKIVVLLKKYIPGTKEAGLAEAMLIGYKEDLDKTLVQSYSNTGVVHIIAISGLHLGLIYWLLMLLCKPLSKYKTGKFVQPILIIAGLWLFSCIAGGSPSVLRSAVMFTCIVIGTFINRKTSIFNSLAASAFLLLCYNPTWLWDAGFQLSYAAVLSLAVFYKPIYNLVFIQNKLLDDKGFHRIRSIRLLQRLIILNYCITL